MALELAGGLVSTEADRLLQAEALVRSYCAWHIAPSREVTLTLDGLGNTVQVLPSLHVTAVTSVTDDGTLLVADTDYTWSEDGALTRADVCRWGARKIEVAFTHGYTDPPAEVTAVVQAVAQRAVDNPGSKPRQQVGPFADTFSQSGFNQAPALTLLDAEKAILDRYRLPALA